MTSIPRVLALDLATTTGWAVDDPSQSGAPVSGSLKLAFDGDDFGGGFAAFSSWMRDAAFVHEPSVVAFEAPIPGQNHGGFNRARILLGLAAITEATAHELGITCYETHIQTVRKHFTGSGRSQKVDVMHRCRLLGWKVLGHDAADACAVWDYAKSILRSKRATA